MNSEFIFLLVNLSSNDNSLRAEAEAKYQALQQPGNNDALPILLLQVILGVSDINQPLTSSNEAKSIPVHTRKLAAVLLRQQLIEPDESHYRSMTSAGQASIKRGLVFGIDNETDNTILSSITDLAGELAGYVMEQNEWPELLPYAYKHLQASDPFKREMGLNLLGLLSNSHINLLLSTAGNVHAIISLFNASLVDISNEGRLMLAAMKSAANVISSVSLDSEVRQLQQLIGPIIQGLSTIISSNHQHMHGITEVTVVSYIDILIELAENKIAFFECQLSYTMESILQMLETKSVSFSIRRMLLETLVTICLQTPKKVRKLKTSDNSAERFVVIKRIINVCVEFIGQIPDIKDWDTAITVEDSVALYTEKNEKQDQASEHEAECMLNSDCGEAALDRILPILGVNCTAESINQLVTHLLSQKISDTSQAWRYPYIAYRVLAIYIDATSQLYIDKDILQFCQYIIGIFDGFLSSSSSSTAHPRVKGAVFYTLGRFIITHGKLMFEGWVDRQLSDEYNEYVKSMTNILQYILSSIPSSVNRSPRVRRNVLACLVNFIDISPRGYIEDKVPSILTTVIQALSEGPIIVQELAVLSISSVSETIREEAGQSVGSMALYYDALMPVLKGILSKCQGSESIELWGETFLCCAILGEASGLEKFHADAVEMMSILLRHNQMKAEVEMNKHLMKAWVRIARCLGAEILPYIPTVMEKLMYAILQDPSENIAGLSAEECENRSDIHMLEKDDGSWLPVRTSIVEEQALACQLLNLLVGRLQEYFYAYVEQTVRVMIPLLKSPHDDVRSYAIVIIPELVRATAKATTAREPVAADRSVLQALTDYSLGQLLEAIEAESRLELVMTGLEALKLTLHYACTDWLKLLMDRQQTMTGLTRTVLMDEPPPLTPEKSIPMLSSAQMDTITSTTKIILRESLQRRSVLRAEIQVSGGKDEDDEAEEEAFMQETLELHYNLSEVLGTLWKTHGGAYYPTYLAHWHEMILELIQPHCLKEDIQFGLFIVADVIEYGLNQETASSYLQTMIPMLIPILSSTAFPHPRQVAAYSLGIACEKYSAIFKPYAASALSALATSVATGDEDGAGSRGECTDNAVAAVGIILEMLTSTTPIQPLPGMDYNFMWGSWLNYLPFTNDLEEGRKVLKQLIRLLNSSNISFLGSTVLVNNVQAYHPQSRLLPAILVLLNAFSTSHSSSDIDKEIALYVQSLRYEPKFLATCRSFDSWVRSLPGELGSKVDQIVRMNQGAMPHFPEGYSPGPSAPIHDLLYRP